MFILLLKLGKEANIVKRVGMAIYKLFGGVTSQIDL